VKIGICQQKLENWNLKSGNVKVRKILLNQIYWDIMKFNNSNKLVLSAISILASAFLLYWTIVYWIFNNLTLHEGQSNLNPTSIISTMILIFITILTIASVVFFIIFFLKAINRKKEKAEI
jgi:hypothetical protein